VLSADAYAAFEETAGADGEPSVETGRKYRQAILEAGGSRSAMDSFKAFRGREPSSMRCCGTRAWRRPSPLDAALKLAILGRCIRPFTNSHCIA
jgi:oligopeptidase A